MTGLVFIRHAETDMVGTFCGHSDPPINDRGREQAIHLSSTFKPGHFDAIHCSDLRRAVETASYLSQSFAIPLATSTNLREIHFGDWEGLTWAEIEKSNPDYAHRWADAFPALPAPNGESFRLFQSRALKEVDDLLSLAKTKRIAVITHAGVMRIILHTLLGHTEEQAWQMTTPYCSSFEFAGPLPFREAIQ